MSQGRGGRAGKALAMLQRGLGALGRPAGAALHTYQQTSARQPRKGNAAASSSSQASEEALTPSPLQPRGSSRAKRQRGREESTLRPSIQTLHHSLPKKKSQQYPKKSLGTQPSSSPSHGPMGRPGTILTPGQKPPTLPAASTAPGDAEPSTVPKVPLHSGSPLGHPCPGRWSLQHPMGDPGTAAAWQGLLCTPGRGHFEHLRSQHLKSWW